jgi:AcrR family transcriptional regulator
MAGPPPPARRVPPGKHELRREFVAHHQRERILAAVADVVAAKGYRSVSVADIVKSARIARAKFYENFSSKEDCFLAAYDHATDEAIRRVTDACQETEASPSVRVVAGLTAFVGFLAEQPALARMCILEGPAAGPVGTARYEQAVERFVPLLAPAREAAPDPSQLPATVEEAVIGGTFWLIYDALLAGQPEPVTELLPQLVEFCLLPFLGAQAAAEAASIAKRPD